MSAGQRTGLDRDSLGWLDELRDGHPRREQAIARLHELLVRVAVHELGRRRAQLGALSGPEFDDLVHQSADDALLKILGKLDEFEGLSRFTTWTYKFAMLEVSSKVARHAWKRQPPSGDLEWRSLPDTFTPHPGEQLERREQLVALSAAIEELGARQREVFVAIAVNGAPIDLVALELGSNRNAIYKNLFDARRNLRRALAARGYPLLSEDGTGT
jgi:RNA polymerase sigma-70 factor (ECF subfamily)